MDGKAVVDLRSDTVTRPSPGMRKAMAEAEVGDDVYGEDPTVNRLQEEAARRLGFQAALFVPTGSMGNQIAIHLHAERGSDVLVEEGNHVYLYEMGTMTAWSGVVPRVLRSAGGIPDPADVERAVAPRVYYLSPSRLLVLENTHNHAGGVVLSQERKDAVLDAARRHGLAVHLDGARIFNAAAALGLPARELADGMDSVMFCLSKGLGAPVGSVLCGRREWIEQARVVRKRMGGGMRQVGILAAAGLYALEHNVERLAEDHRRARRLAEVLADSPVFRLDSAAVQTNIVIAEVAGGRTVDEVLAWLAERGVLAGAMGPGRIRFVTHLDVDETGLGRAVEAIRTLV